MTINFSREKPPSWVYDKAVALFNVSFDNGGLVTYSEALKQIKQ